MRNQNTAEEGMNEQQSMSSGKGGDVCCDRCCGSKGGSRSKRWISLVIFGVGVLILAYAFVYPSLPNTPGDAWQAVFLTNGQAYFGHLSSAGKEYVKMENVYYLRATQLLQQETNQPTPAFDLVKLGGELHGPEDVMYVAKNSILFWENLKGDSQVVQAINNFASEGATQ